MKNFVKLMEKFSSARILVVGDVMLDQYWWGRVERISPEAPVPVVRLDKRNVVPGGAANVAANISGLGARCSLIGAVGNDDTAEFLRASLRKLKIDTKNLLTDAARPTSTKTRVVAHGQHVVRVDDEFSKDVSFEIEKKILRAVLREIKLTDVVVLSDYAKGVLTENLISTIISAARGSGVSVIVDPKGKDYSKYRGANILTPNKREAMDATGEATIEKAAAKLMRELALDSLLITKGEEGISIFERSSRTRNLKASARHVFDVTGAGDTVIATLAVAHASGCGLDEACTLANLAAGIVVEEVGTTAVTFERLRESLQSLT